MEDFIDYYEVLQVSPNAESEVIEAAYKKLAQKYHPDINKSSKAVGQMKLINIAHDVLGNPEKRKTYDLERLQEKSAITTDKTKPGIGKPKPIVDPQYIKFKNVKAGEVKTSSFLIFNAGGPYSMLRINSPESWLIVTDYHSLTPSDELPLKVNIQALATKWSTLYSGAIIVELDKNKVILPVELKTRMKLQFKDHEWHDMDYDNLRDWVKTSNNKAKLDAGKELPGKIFRYRFNRYSGKYQVRLRYSHKTGTYETP